MSVRGFPPPWTVEIIPGGFKVCDANGQSLAYVYSRENPNDTHMAKVLTVDEARRIASNIAKLPSLLGGRIWSGVPELTCSARPNHSVICFDRALIRLAARRKRTNGFAVKLEERSPKPAFVQPEHFESQVSHIMVAHTAPRHSAIPLG